MGSLARRAAGALLMCGLVDIGLVAGVSAQVVSLERSDGTSVILSRSGLSLDGQACVPLTDLAIAIHGAPTLHPSLALRGSTLQVVRTNPEEGRGSAERGFLRVERSGVISHRVRSVAGSEGRPQACVPAPDLARALGGALRTTGRPDGAYEASIGGFDSKINAMKNNNMVFLSLQTKVQNVAQTTQMRSNVAKADSDAKLNAIRNMRTALFEETESALAGMPPDQVAWARSFATRRGHRATRTEREGAIRSAFPSTSPKQKVKIHMILLEIMTGDVTGALRSYSIMMDRDASLFSRPRARREYAEQDPPSTARPQDRARRYTQFVQVSTQLMGEIQDNERELVDALQSMHRDLDNLWQAYATMRDR